MLDFYMLLVLAGSYFLFAGFLHGCGTIADETGGGERDDRGH